MVLLAWSGWQEWTWRDVDGFKMCRELMGGIEGGDDRNKKNKNKP